MERKTVRLKYPVVLGERFGAIDDVFVLLNEERAKTPDPSTGLNYDIEPWHVAINPILCVAASVALIEITTHDFRDSDKSRL